MKDFMDFEEHKAMKEKRSKKMNSKGKKKEDLYEDNLEILLTKKPKPVKSKSTKTKSSTSNDGSFKNNYKNFQYDYEEDLYDPDYGY